MRAFTDRIRFIATVDAGLAALIAQGRIGQAFKELPPGIYTGTAKEPGYPMQVKADPLDKQIDGNHYKSLPIQPVEYIAKNGIGYFEGNVIKYVSRWRNKGGIADLEKAKHYLELLIKFETDAKNNG